jgi:3-methyladenine DNA glycosylase AlkD
MTAKGATAALDWLKSHATKAGLEGMARYGLSSERAFGVASAAARWVGKDALRELTSPALMKRLAQKRMNL